jgi:hypothetical protein
MYRRDCLAALHIGSLTAVGGCLAAPRTDDGGSTSVDGNTPTVSTDIQPANGDDVVIVVSNSREAPLDVTLTLTSGDDDVYTDTVAVDAGERRPVDPGIDAEGTYTLLVTLSYGTEHARSFDVEAYDLRTGANLIVDIDDRVRVLMEE